MTADEISTKLVGEVEITKSNDIMIPDPVYETIFPESPGPTHAIWYSQKTGSTEYLYITDRKYMTGDHTYIDATQLRNEKDETQTRVTVPKPARDYKNLQRGQSLFFYLREGEAEEENPSATLLTEDEAYSFFDIGINESSETAFPMKFARAPGDNFNY